MEKVGRRAAAALALLTLTAGLLAIVLLGEAERTAASTDTRPAGADSTRVIELQERFAADDESTAVVLFTSDSEDTALDRADLPALQRLLDDARAALPVAGGPAGTSRLVPSEDGTAVIGVVPVTGASATAVSEAVGVLRDRLDEGLPAGVTAQVTGPAAIQADLAAVFDGADTRLLLATASVVAVLLILTYRSPVLWLVPVLVVGIADRAAVSLASHALEALDMAWDESTVGILSVLVFGAGTDYALLLISRYRDELRAEPDRYAAMRRAVARTAEAVLSSAVTVVVGLLTLLLSVVPSTRGLGLACAVGIVVAATAALVALPATLVLCGRWVFWPVTPRVGQASLVEGRSLWRRVGDAVARRPAGLAAVTVVVIAALAGGLTQVRVGLPESQQFLETPESIAAADRLAESYPAGTVDPTTIITAAPADEVTARVEGTAGVEAVRPAGEADGLARLQAVLAAAPGSGEAAATVERLREALAPYPETYVGGTVAEELDADAAAERDRWLIVPLILGLVVVALVLLLRSLVAPLILVATVVATYFAALGAAWWVFTGVFDFPALDVGVPLLAFLFLVALGVDYNIFLVTRAAEEGRHAGAREGMLRALAATGGVITSAGILLAAVFAVLGVLPLVVLAQLGVVIGIGVLLDTLVVRTVLVPALAVRLGDRFWWPRRVDRPRAGDGGAAAEAHEAPSYAAR